jgi:hypothetical protein
MLDRQTLPLSERESPMPGLDPSVTQRSGTDASSAPDPFRRSGNSPAAAARRAGATPPELVGVVETALFTAGMPAYELGMAVLADLLAGPGSL